MSLLYSKILHRDAFQVHPSGGQHHTSLLLPSSPCAFSVTFSPSSPQSVSVQLVINTFEDIKDRENIVHLLTRQVSRAAAFAALGERAHGPCAHEFLTVFPLCAQDSASTSGAFYDAHSGKKKDKRAKKLFAFQAGCFMLRHSVLDNTLPQEPGAGRGRHEVDNHGAKPGPET